MDHLPTHDELKKLLIYHSDTGELYWKKRIPKMFEPGEKHDRNRKCKSWNARFAGKKALCSIHPQGYRMGRICNRRYLAHRVIWCLVTGDWPKEETDHINGDRGNNKFINLRDASRFMNMQNQKINTRNTSGCIGVSWHRRKKKWSVTISFNRKLRHLGVFTDFSEAVKVRKHAEKHYGFHKNHGRKE